MKKLHLLLIPFLVFPVANAQLRNDDVYKTDMYMANVRQMIEIPDVDGYKVIKSDLHIHTAFSDGKVWPDARVDEAWVQGLDAIAITDHIEVRPYKILRENVDLNESFNIAKNKAKQLGMIIVKGIEITRAKPYGHMNALFITDANPLAIKDSIKVLDIAREQGGIIMWNHPGWPDDKSTMYDVHRKLLNEKKIDIFEVHNGSEYYPLTFDWVDEYDLAPAANSDIHNEIIYFYGTQKAARPMTLIFAKEKTEASMKEALLAHRTAAYFDGNIMATKSWAEKIFKACVKYKIITNDNNKTFIEFTNISDLPFVVIKSNGNNLNIAPRTIYRTQIGLDETITVRSIFVAKNRYLELKVSDLEKIEK